MSMPDVLIAIPTLNGPHRLERCLTSIFKIPDTTHYIKSLIILDDCSTPENLEANKQICARYNINLLMHNNRLGVATAWNNLSNFSDSKYIILLNDDIEVVKSWLDVFIYTMENNEWIGALGFNAWEGPSRYLNINISPAYSEANLLYGSPNLPLLSTKGFAFGFKRTDYLLVDGFDRNYFCFFEEVDFNLKLLQLGKRNCILNYPNLYHSGGETTTSNLPNPESIFEQSKAYFENKWNVKWENLRSIFNKSNIAMVPSEINEWNSNFECWN